VPRRCLARAASIRRLIATPLRWLPASEPERKRILPVDGPAVIGWQKWRDRREVLMGARRDRGAGEGAPERDVDAAAHLLLGAVMEAALVCAAADDPRRAARQHVAALRRMLAGLVLR
jgi:hypothetical protein